MTRTIFKGIIVSVFFIMVYLPTWAAEKPAENAGPGQMPAVQMMEVLKDIQLERDIVYATMGGHELKLDIAYPKAIEIDISIASLIPDFQI